MYKLIRIIRCFIISINCIHIFLIILITSSDSWEHAGNESRLQILIFFVAKVQEHFGQVLHLCENNVWKTPVQKLSGE